MRRLIKDRPLVVQHHRRRRIAPARERAGVGTRVPRTRPRPRATTAGSSGPRSAGAVGHIFVIELENEDAATTFGPVRRRRS